jgi:Lar family restriction alleviation protein
MSEELKAEMPGDHIGEVNNMVLKPCPFCGGEADLYYDKQDPDFPFTVRCGDCDVERCMIYEDKEEAIAAWNRRTPDPMTNVITWTRYDGTPETLPEIGEFVLLNTKDKGVIGVWWSDRDDGIDFWLHPTGCREAAAIEVALGDLWVYLPQPPKEKK